MWLQVVHDMLSEQGLKKTLTLTSGDSQAMSVLTEGCRRSSTEFPRENILHGLSGVTEEI